MGIQGLIPFLEKASQPVNISQFSGCTVAVDAYCWLHKGAFACAEKLARGDHTDQYVVYCMKYVNMLLHNNIKPILVFDGSHLKAKADTEKKRRESREINRRKAAELLRLDRPNEAKTFLRRCVDVTHEMALNLIKECRSRNVDCIVAPFEADAQLAYFNLQDVAQIVITEDSDLLLFGCKKVLFKMDTNGNGLLVDQTKLYLAMGVRENTFSLDKFRHMCILSGCDYLPSLPGIGLAKACRFITRSIDPDIHKALTRLPMHLNMSLSVSPEYRDKFMEADSVFRYQPVFDPFTRKVVPLTSPPEGESPPDLWVSLPQDQAEQLALGNLDPFTLKRMDDWQPGAKETQLRRSTNWNGKAPHKSIWSPDFLEAHKKAREISENKKKNAGGAFVIERPSTLGKQVVQKAKTPTKKRPNEDIEDEKNQLLEMYGSGGRPAKKPCHKQRGLDEEIEEDISPVKPRPLIRNPFAKSACSPASADAVESKLSGRHRKTVVDESLIMVSGYFCDSPEPATKENPNVIESSQDHLDEPIEDAFDLNETNSAAELVNLYARKPLVDIKNTSPPASPEKLNPPNASPPTSPEIITTKCVKQFNPFGKKAKTQKDENESLLDTFDNKTKKAPQEPKNDSLCAKIANFDPEIGSESVVKQEVSEGDLFSEKIALFDSEMDDKVIEPIKKETLPKRDSFSKKMESLDLEIDETARTTAISKRDSDRERNTNFDAKNDLVSSRSVTPKPSSGSPKKESCRNFSGGTGGNFFWAKKLNSFKCQPTLFKKSFASSQEFKSPAQQSTSSSPVEMQVDKGCDDITQESSDVSSLEKNIKEDIIPRTTPVKENGVKSVISSQESDEGFCSPSLESKFKGRLTLKQATPSSTKKTPSQQPCRRPGLSKKSPSVDAKQSSLKDFLFKAKPKMC